MAVPLELLKELVAQHERAWAMLLGEIGLAFDATLAAWSKVFPDPIRIAGGTLCSDVHPGAGDERDPMKFNSRNVEALADLICGNHGGEACR